MEIAQSENKSSQSAKIILLIFASTPLLIIVVFDHMTCRDGLGCLGPAFIAMGILALSGFITGILNASFKSKISTVFLYLILIIIYTQGEAFSALQDLYGYFWIPLCLGLMISSIRQRWRPVYILSLLIVLGGSITIPLTYNKYQYSHSTDPSACFQRTYEKAMNDWQKQSNLSLRELELKMRTGFYQERDRLEAQARSECNF